MTGSSDPENSPSRSKPLRYCLRNQMSVNGRITEILPYWQPHQSNSTPVVCHPPLIFGAEYRPQNNLTFEKSAVYNKRFRVYFPKQLLRNV